MLDYLLLSLQLLHLLQMWLLLSLLPIVHCQKPVAYSLSKGRSLLYYYHQHSEKKRQQKRCQPLLAALAWILLLILLLSLILLLILVASLRHLLSAA